MYTTLGHLTYLLLSVALTVWVARTIHRHGRVFLVDTFNRNEALADSVNALLVVGFYLVNIGYVTLALKYADTAFSAAEVIEHTSTRIGRVLLVLGGMHFFNLYVFARMRRRALLKNAAPPVLSYERVHAES